MMVVIVEWINMAPQVQIQHKAAFYMALITLGKGKNLFILPSLWVNSKADNTL